ncbi:MAG: hypothetical protein U0R76_11595 [Candidatus Nanopelagicales bacterium]
MDAGDRVVWRDGGRRADWTLPDQPAVPGLPVLSAVVLATSDTQVATGPSSPVSLLLLVDRAGETLARIAQASLDLTDALDEADLERIWPSEAFDALRARGVEVRREEYTRLSDLESAHPGAVGRTLRFFGQTAGTLAWWAAGAALLVAAAAWFLSRT